MKKDYTLLIFSITVLLLSALFAYLLWTGVLPIMIDPHFCANDLTIGLLAQVSAIILLTAIIERYMHKLFKRFIK